MIQLNALQKIIGRTLVVDIETLTVEAGEITAVVGPVSSGIELVHLDIKPS